MQTYLMEIDCELDSVGSEYAALAGSCEHGNEPSGSVKGGKFIGQLSY
jgi:hypothetical protein